MTIEEVIARLESITGKKAAAITPLKDLVDDSLEFLELMVEFCVADSLVPMVDTVNDLCLATEGRL